MAYIDRISYNLNRRDEVPNQELAKELAELSNTKGLDEMASYLFDKNKSIASDCLKVLYEASYLKPELIVSYYDDFIKLLNSKNNRMVWGSMIAIASIAKVEPEKVYKHVELIRDKIETGSLITNVHGVYTLINMAGASEGIYNDIIKELFMILDHTRPVDFAKRAEALVEILHEGELEAFVQLCQRNKERLSAAGGKRVDKVLKKIDF